MDITETHDLITVLNRGGYLYAVPFQAEAWHMVLKDLPVELAREAAVDVMNTFDKNAGYSVRPADIKTAAKAIRKRRLDAAPVPEVPAAIAADGAAYIRWLRTYNWHVGAGATPNAAYETATAQIGATRTAPQIASQTALQQWAGRAGQMPD